MQKYFIWQNLDSVKCTMKYKVPLHISIFTARLSLLGQVNIAKKYEMVLHFLS